MEVSWTPLLRQSLVISSAAEGSYLEIPFEVPPDCEALRVEISVSGDGAVIDLGLKNPQAIIGWSGGARRRIEIFPEQATPGYLPGAPASGSWAIVLGAYEVPREGCSLEADVHFAGAGPRWLRGDLHVHTTHSDGTDAPFAVAAALSEVGLDFVALTDHNNGTAYRSYPADSSVLAIPGVEWTTLGGHANLLGVDRPLRDFRARDREDVRRLADEARARGALLSVSHPFEDSCKGCRWEWGFEDLPLDAIEVWNGPWRPANAQAVDWWQSALSAGRRLPAIGGSDRHAPHPLVQYGLPTNWVFSASRTGEAILDGVRRGRVCLTASPSGPLLDLRCGAAMQGDLVALDGASGLRITVSAAAKGDRLLLISERGVEQELTLSEDGMYAHEWGAGGRRFWRAELLRWSEQWRYELPAAISNPIYFATSV